MDFLNTTKPISIIKFSKINIPGIELKDIEFLNNWRDCITKNNTFTGWSKIKDSDRKTRLLTCAKEYTEYLYDWATFRESLFNTPEHVTDNNNG